MTALLTVRIVGLVALLVVLALATTTAAPTTTATFALRLVVIAVFMLTIARLVPGLFVPLLGLGLRAIVSCVLIVQIVGNVVREVFLVDDRFEMHFLLRFAAGAAHRHLGALGLAIGQDFDHDAIAFLDLGQLITLGIEDVDRRFLAGAQRDFAALALGGFLLDVPQRRKPGGRRRAHKARAFAMRALAGRCFQHAGAQTLTAHLHQTEARDAANLNAGAVVLQRLLEAALHLPVVAVLFHVDEIDHDQTGHIAQTQLPGDFARGFHVGGQRRLLDPMFLGGSARVDIDRDQRLGRVDHDIAAGLQLHDRLVHRGKLVFHAMALEQWDRVRILLHLARMARHQQFHEGFGGFVAFVPFDQHLVDLAIIDIADGTFDQRAVAVDQRRCGAAQRAFADLVPQARQIIEVALDFRLGAGKTGGPHDAAHGAGQVQIVDDRFQTLAIGRAGNLPADAAAMRRVGHQHAIAPGERQISGQRRAFIAALFLDNLHQQDLTTMNDVLDLVAAAQLLALGARGIAGPGGGPSTTIAIAFTATPTSAATRAGLIVVRVIIGVVALEIRNLAFLGIDGVDRRVLVDFDQLRFVEAVIVVVGSVCRIVGIVFCFARGGFFFGGLSFFSEQPVAIFLGDLIIIRVDFGEGQEAVAVAAIIDERRLQRGFDPGNLG